MIWQESRFNAHAVSAKGAQGIAQFMPATADYRGLVDPFDPIEALKNSASYLHDLKTQFGNLGLAAAAYNAGPGRVSAFLANRSSAAERDAQLCRDHHRLDRRRMGLAVAAADAGDHDPAGHPLHAACQSDPGAEGGGAADRVLCAALGHAAHRQLVGDQGLGHLSRESQKKYAGLIGDREPIVITSRGIGLGSALRYNIRIADDDRGYLQKFCNKLMAAGGACVVLRNDRG